MLRVLLCVFASSACAALVAPQAALGVVNDPDNSLPKEGPCLLGVLDFKLQGNLVVVGVPLAGSQVQINATSVKIVGSKVTPTRICDELLFQVPKASWTLVSKPAGQAASIVNEGTLSPGVNVGGPGAYRIRLTACASTCRLTSGGKSKTVGPFTRDVTINVVTSFAPPPETEPLLPPLFAPGAGTNPPEWSGPTAAPPRFSDSQREAKCNGGGGVKDPQWVTAEPFAGPGTEPFGGPGNYRTVEGVVKSSRSAWEDSFLNHDSQDHIWDVKPDPPYRGFPTVEGGEMDMEWESNAFPREFRPTAGDRISAAGFWIFDCGHDFFLSEIHPPVGVAVERPRAVPIPPEFSPPGFPNGFGTKLQVPGIVTDIFFNRRSGETTSNCSTTGLASPSLDPTSPQLSAAFCVREPHALNRRFTFNIYLPRNPQQRAQELGLSPPPVPVFVGVDKLSRGSGGPEPDPPVVRQGGGATWVEVTVDLSTLPASQMQYARRISAAWAYPEPGNWGARRWRVRLKNIEVVDDAEPFGQDGDWRFFFNTNNRDREWTQVLNCDGCVDDDETKSLEIETGTAAGSSEGLGPDLVLFPGQPIVVHTTGYDEEVLGDDVGTVFSTISQKNPPQNYRESSNGGDGFYRLNYATGGGASIDRAVLTPEAGDLLSAYTVRAKPQCIEPPASQAKAGPGPPARVCVISPNLRDPNFVERPDVGAVVLRKRVQKVDSLHLFEDESEPFTIQGISPSKLRALFNGLLKSDPKRLDALLEEIKQELRAVPSSLRRDYYELVTTLDQALPKNLRERPYPPGFRKQVKKFPKRR